MNQTVCPCGKEHSFLGTVLSGEGVLRVSPLTSA